MEKKKRVLYVRNDKHKTPKNKCKKIKQKDELKTEHKK